MQMRRVEFVGPQVGQELATDGAMALLFAGVGLWLGAEVRRQALRWGAEVFAALAKVLKEKNFRLKIKIQIIKEKNFQKKKKSHLQHKDKVA